MPLSMLLRDHPVASLQARIDGVAAEPRASAAEVLERHRLDAHDVGEALELERLDGELVGANGVEHTVEGVLLAVVAGVDVAVAAARAEVVVVDLHLVAAWPEPLNEQVGFGVGAEHGGDGGVELALPVDERHAFWCGHGEWVGAHWGCSLVGLVGPADSAPAIVGEQSVEGAELLLVDQPVAVDPGGHRFELGGVEVDRAALGVPGPRHEAGMLEHLDVLGHRLFGDGERFGELVDGRRPAAEAGDDPSPHRVGERHERPVEPIIGGRVDDQRSASRVIKLSFDQLID